MGGTKEDFPENERVNMAYCAAEGGSFQFSFVAEALKDRSVFREKRKERVPTVSVGVGEVGYGWDSRDTFAGY